MNNPSNNSDNLCIFCGNELPCPLGHIQETDFCSCVGCQGWLDDSSSSEETSDDEDFEGHDDSMDGDHESALASAGMGTDESYGLYEDLDADFEDW